MSVGFSVGFGVASHVSSTTRWVSPYLPTSRRSLTVRFTYPRAFVWSAMNAVRSSALTPMLRTDPPLGNDFFLALHFR